MHSKYKKMLRRSTVDDKKDTEMQTCKWHSWPVQKTDKTGRQTRLTDKQGTGKYSK
jgi:hypothetical protein